MTTDSVPSAVTSWPGESTAAATSLDDWDFPRSSFWSRPLTWVIVTALVVAAVLSYFLFAAGVAGASGGCGGG